MSRFARSWAMTKTSFKVIQQDKELLWLPVLSFIATIVTVLAIAGVGAVAGVFPQITDAAGNVNPIGLLFAALMYLGLAFVQVFFHAATVAGAHERLGGGDPTVRSAIGKAWAHVGRLFVWSLMVATVNVLLQMLRERGGFLGQIASSIAGVAWNLATYFVVPLLLFDDKSVGQGLKASGGLFKKTWGESVVGEIGIGLAATIFTVGWVIIALLLTILLAGLGAGGLIAGIVIGILGVVVISVVFTVAGAVYKTALFRFATVGAAGPGFDQGDMAGAFHVR